jgi:hypothetical protein
MDLMEQANEKRDPPEIAGIVLLIFAHEVK